MTKYYSLTEKDIKEAIASWITQSQEVVCMSDDVVLQVTPGDRPMDKSSITAQARIKETVK